VAVRFSADLKSTYIAIAHQMNKTGLSGGPEFITIGCLYGKKTQAMQISRSPLQRENIT